MLFPICPDYESCKYYSSLIWLLTIVQRVPFCNYAMKDQKPLKSSFLTIYRLICMKRNILNNAKTSVLNYLKKCGGLLHSNVFYMLDKLQFATCVRLEVFEILRWRKTFYSYRHLQRTQKKQCVEQFAWIEENFRAMVGEPGKLSQIGWKWNWGVIRTPI